MKRMNLKAAVAKVMTIGMLAGAMAIAMPAKAQAQEFAMAAFHPRYNYSHFDSFEFQRREAIRRAEIRREERMRRERFDRFHRFER